MPATTGSNLRALFNLATRLGFGFGGLYVRVTSLRTEWRYYFLRSAQGDGYDI